MFYNYIRHINIQYYYIREIIINGDVKLKYMLINNVIVNRLIKVFLSNKFNKFRNLIKLRLLNGQS